MDDDHTFPAGHLGLCLEAVARDPQVGLSFLGKSQLFKRPALAWLFKHLNAIPLHQGAGDIHALRETIKLLKDGHILTIFPEGSRTDANVIPCLVRNSR